MKRPKIGNLKENIRETKKIRKLARGTKKLKVTINLDKEVVERLKELAESSGSKYQTLLNKILKEALISKNTFDERIKRLEAEIRDVKQRLAKVA